MEYLTMYVIGFWLPTILLFVAAVLAFRWPKNMPGKKSLCSWITVVLLGSVISHFANYLTYKGVLEYTSKTYLIISSFLGIIPYIGGVLLIFFVVKCPQVLGGAGSSLKKSKRRRRWGVCFKGIGGFAQFGGIIGMLVAINSGLEFVIILAVVSGCGAMLLHLGKKMAQLSGEELLDQDKRDPVLLLRSFSRDDVAHTDYNKMRMKDYFGLEPGLKAIQRENKRNIGFEELVAQQVEPLGPFIAIGRPGETFPAVGASRFYETDETWKDRVTEFVKKSSAIIIILDMTPGLMWELSHLKDVRIRSKTLLVSVATPDKVKQQDVFREWEQLIAEHASIQVSLDETVVGIYFDEHGLPIVLHSREHDIAVRIGQISKFIEYRNSPEN